MKTIVLTGGGSAGHVTPNIALIPELEKHGWHIHYIGTHTGIEKELIKEQVPYHSISAGKLRRYFDIKNFSDPFRVLKGVYDSYRILRRIRPKIIFSKGGFVSLPVTIAARLLRIPVVLHESDITPGLANKLAFPIATHLCVTFPETLNYVAKDNVTLTGNPIRRTLFSGDKQAGLSFCGFGGQKPVILVMGGSLGAARINAAIWEGLSELTKQFEIIHICGKGNVKPEIHVPGYKQFEYVNHELANLFAAADLVVSRAGANAIFELLALQKPHLLIPLSQAASRGDQVLNAESFAKQGYSLVLEESELTSESLIATLTKLLRDKERYRQAMQNSPITDATQEVIKIIDMYSKNLA